MRPDLLSLPVRDMPTDSPTMQHEAQEAVQGESAATAGVGHHPMTDDEREYAIRQAGDELMRLQGVYSGSGDANDRQARDEARRYMETLIRGRSEAQVRKMERERGLA